MALDIYTLRMALKQKPKLNIFNITKICDTQKTKGKERDKENISKPKCILAAAHS